MTERNPRAGRKNIVGAPRQGDEWVDGLMGATPSMYLPPLGTLIKEDDGPWKMCVPVGLTTNPNGSLSWTAIRWQIL